MDWKSIIQAMLMSSISCDYDGFCFVFSSYISPRALRVSATRIFFACIRQTLWHSSDEHQNTVSFSHRPWFVALLCVACLPSLLASCLFLCTSHVCVPMHAAHFATPPALLHFDSFSLFFELLLCLGQSYRLKTHTRCAASIPTSVLFTHHLVFVSLRILAMHSHNTIMYCTHSTVTASSVVHTTVESRVFGNKLFQRGTNHMWCLCVHFWWFKVYGRYFRGIAPSLALVCFIACPCLHVFDEYFVPCIVRQWPSSFCLLRLCFGVLCLVSMNVTQWNTVPALQLS